MKYTPQHCWDKTMDGKMTIYRECCFPSLYKIMVSNVTFAGFRGGRSPQSPHPWIPPDQRYSKTSYIPARNKSRLYYGLSHMQLLNSQSFKAMIFLTVYHTGQNVGQEQLTTFRGLEKLANCSESFYRRQHLQKYKNQWHHTTLCCNINLAMCTFKHEKLFHTKHGNVTFIFETSPNTKT